MASERSQRRIERLLDEADEAVTRLDWETVSARVTAVLALEPDNADAHTLLAAVYFIYRVRRATILANA